MKKETMKRIVLTMLMLSVIFMLCACNKALDIPVKNSDGSMTIVGLLITQAIEILAELALFAVAAFSAFAAEKLGKNLKLKNLNIAIQNVCDITRQTVDELQQTMVEKMKYLNDGKLTNADIVKLGDALRAIVKEKLDTATQELIVASGADLDAIIKGECEAHLSRMKAYYTSPASTAEPVE